MNCTTGFFIPQPDNISKSSSKNRCSHYRQVSDIFCALRPLETIWSTTIQEAFAAGVPCIITKAGTTETHLKHEETAYLIKSQSPRERAKAILALIRE